MISAADVVGGFCRVLCGKGHAFTPVAILVITAAVSIHKIGGNWLVETRIFGFFLTGPGRNESPQGPSSSGDRRIFRVNRLCAP